MTGLLLIAASACATAGPASVERLTTSDLVVADGAGDRIPLHALWRGHPATVLIFWSATCPCVRRYQKRAEALIQAWAPFGVRVVGISSNAGEPFEDVRQAAQARGLRLPIYRDEDGSLARSLEVRTTPTTVVLDAQGAVRFRGWIDNEREPGVEGRQPWVEQALHAILSGRADFRSRTPVYGCAITRSLTAPGAAHCAVPDPEEEP